MALTEDEILSEIKELKSWLYGANGYEGDIPEIKQAVRSLRKDYDKLAKIVYVLIGTLVGSGVIGSSIWRMMN